MNANMLLENTKEVRDKMCQTYDRQIVLKGKTPFDRG